MFQDRFPGSKMWSPGSKIADWWSVPLSTRIWRKSMLLEVGFDVCEVHTGQYAEVFLRSGGDLLQPELVGAIEEVRDAGRRITGHGMRFNAGHALNFHNVHHIASLPGVDELHIGHSIVARAMFVGLRSAVAEMKAILNRVDSRRE